MIITGHSMLCKGGTIVIIRDMFADDINCKINGVIKVDHTQKLYIDLISVNM